MNSSKDRCLYRRKADEKSKYLSSGDLLLWCFQNCMVIFMLMFHENRDLSSIFPFLFFSLARKIPSCSFSGHLYMHGSSAFLLHTFYLKETLEMSAKQPIQDKKQVKKRSLHIANEHFELTSNAGRQHR